MDTLRSTAHLQREAGDELFALLISSDNTREVVEFLKKLRAKKAGTTTFVVSDHFKVDTSDTAEVKISYIGDNFRDWTKGMAEDVSAGVKAPVIYHDLSKDSLDKDIISDLGGQEKATVTPAGIYQLMKQQGNGEAGILLNNGYANIFYVLIGGVLRAVGVHWLVVGWRVGANSVDVPGWSPDLFWQFCALIF